MFFPLNLVIHTIHVQSSLVFQKRSFIHFTYGSMSLTLK